MSWRAWLYYYWSVSRKGLLRIPSTKKTTLGSFIIMIKLCKVKTECCSSSTDWKTHHMSKTPKKPSSSPVRAEIFASEGGPLNFSSFAPYLRHFLIIRGRGNRSNEQLYPKEKVFLVEILGGAKIFFKIFWSKIAIIAKKRPSWLIWVNRRISKPHYFGLRFLKSFETPWFSVSKKHTFARTFTIWKFWGSDFSPEKNDKGGPLCSVQNSQKSALLTVSKTKKIPKKYFCPPKNLNQKYFFCWVKLFIWAISPIPWLLRNVGNMAQITKNR